MTKTTIAIVDDHELMAKALSGLVQKYEEYEVLYEASNGQELLERIRQNNVPDVALLDINIPVMNGFETALWLKNNHPNIKVLALSMNDREESIVGMARAATCSKAANPANSNKPSMPLCKKGFIIPNTLRGNSSEA